MTKTVRQSKVKVVKVLNDHRFDRPHWVHWTRRCLFARRHTRTLFASSVCFMDRAQFTSQCRFALTHEVNLTGTTRILRGRQGLPANQARKLFDFHLKHSNLPPSIHSVHSGKHFLDRPSIRERALSKRGRG